MVISRPAGILAPWTGLAYRHIPAGSPYSVLDFRFAGSSSDNRWNVAGEPTLYLAGDYGVVLAEYARHFDHERALREPQLLHARQLYRLEITLEALADLRDERVWQSLSLVNPPICFLDKSIARVTASYLRQATAAQGIIVPSMAFLDDLSRWSCLLFLEKLPTNPAQYIRRAQPERILRLDPGPPPGSG